MDQRLLSVARSGDIDQLNAILKDDASALEKEASLPGGESLLHVAALAGKAEFVKELARIKPTLVHEANKEGLTALHIACARGNLVISRELLNLSPVLIHAKDKGSRTALHYAAIKGRVTVIREILSKCPEAVNQATDKGENCLHLAAKGSQFEAMKVLLELLDENKADELLNNRDEEGQTVLQAAEANKQLQICKLLNKDAQTPEFPNPLTGSSDGTTSDDNTHRAADTRAHNIRRRRPLMKQARKQKQQQQQKHQQKQQKQADTNVEDDNNKQELEPAEAVFQNISRGLDERAAFVASLLASVTYSTGLSPPPNLWAEHMKLNVRCLQHGMYLSKDSDPIDACPSRLYLVFTAFNTAGFFSAMLLSFLYRRTSYARMLLASALSFMVLSYFSLATSLTPNFFGLAVILGSTLVSFVVILIFVSFMKSIIKGIIRLVIRALLKVNMI